MSDGKPSVLIIGGVGYIGRWLAHHLYTNELASEIRIVDKQLPALTWLAPEFEKPCANFVQADMSREASAQKVFERSDGTTFDYVFNCAGETRYDQDEDLYKQRNFNLPLVCAKEAAKRGVKLFVELGDGRIYKGTKNKETDELKPWLPLAKYKVGAEEELKKIEGLNLVVLRLASTYGPYSSKTIATAICNAKVYQETGEEMQLLWTKDLKINTVHITDVTKAIWHVTQWYVKGKDGWNDEWGTTPVFNIVDDGNTSQGTLADIVEEVFKVKTSFLGTIISQFAKLNLDEAVDEANEGVLQPWAELLDKAGIHRPGPISPYIEKEALKDYDLCLDGTRFKTVTGFSYDVPAPTAANVEELVDSYKRMGWWP
ncbi:hypothetical protein ABW19_dt0202776 [Dactylella cylindrospora]|nr:hypothetical protein ABW19_dt0202776 [Dactylella cylindrospora]